MTGIEFEILKNALIAAFFASIVCGFVGALVYVNGLTFMAGGIAHSAYGGIGLSVFFDFPMEPTTLGYTLVVSVIMGMLTRRDRGRIDSVVGLIWAGGMALGVILMDLTPGYHVDMMSYLFGSLVMVSSRHILFIALLSLLVGVIILLGYQKFLIISFDEEFARSRGIRVEFFYYLLLSLIAVAVVVLIQIVGLILIIALLSIPPYLSSYTSRSLGGMMFQSFLWSILFCFLGIFGAYYYNISTGACIIAVAVIGGMFFLGVRNIFNFLSKQNI